MKSKYLRADKILNDMLSELSVFIKELGQEDFVYLRSLNEFAKELHKYMKSTQLRSRNLETKQMLGYFMQRMEEIREKENRRKTSTTPT